MVSRDMAYGITADVISITYYLFPGKKCSREEQEGRLHNMFPRK